MKTTRKFEVWLDSGANIHSSYKQVVSLEDVGFTSKEWDAMAEKEQEEFMREIAFERSDWGYSEITD